MQEKLKNLHKQVALKDDQLEMMLFALNNRSLGCVAALHGIEDAVKNNVKLMDSWIVPRLRSSKPLPEGVRHEIRTAMNTMRDLAATIDVVAEYLRFFQAEKDRQYREADKHGHFEW